jgi:hypothetical protein
MKMIPRLSICLAAALSTLTGPLAAQTNEPARFLADARLLPQEAQEFSLEGPQIHKVNRRSKDLTVEDLNGDGLADILVTTNEKSILEVFYRKKSPAGQDDQFDKQTITLDRIIRSVVAMDVNGDGRNDLLMAGSPPRLVVMYQDDKGRLQPAQETGLEADRLSAGDIDGDGKQDVLVFKQGRFTILKGEARSLNLDARETVYTTGEPASDPMIIDLDGDGLNDIVYHDANKFDELVVRLQSPEKTFPSEFRTRTSVLRVVTPFPRGKGQAANVIAVQNVTRELVQLALTEPKEAKAQVLPLSAVQTIPFDPETKSSKSTPIVTDFDGDGRKDMVIYSADLSVLRLLRQTRTGSLVESTIPSLQGIDALIPLEAAKGKPTPMVMFSSGEKAIAYVRFDEKAQTLPFPTILPVSGQPEGIAVLDIAGKQQLATVIKKDEGELQLLGYPIDGEGKLGASATLFPETPDFKSPIAGLDVIGLESMDLNQDQRSDLIVYADFKPAVLLLQDAQGKFNVVSATSGVLQGLLQGAKPSTLDSAILDKPEEVTAIALKEKFARAFHIDKDLNVDVEQQFNGRNSTARIVSMAVGHLEKKDRANVVLLDKGNKVLTIYGPAKEKDGEFEILTNVDLDNADYTSVRVFDLDDDGKDDIVITADDRIGIFYARPVNAGLETVATAKTSVDDGGYGKVYTVDVIPGGLPEIIAVEMKDQLMEIFSAGTDAEKKPALNRFCQFRMFDSEATIARRVNLDALPEPREVVAQDLNDDGKPELICLMHDNIVIYTQSAKAEKPAEKKEVAGAEKR